MRIAPLLALTLAACATPPAATPPAPPGIATAWVTFDASGVTGSGADGIADRATGRRITIDDPARVASISKLVVAIGVMRLVEAGKLDLDADVSDALGWRLRNPAWPETPITLRLLLSHRSSLRDEIDYVLPLDRELKTALADPKVFDRAHAPGSHFRYANIGFPVVASVVERATGERFDRVMQREILAPLALDACFNWSTCSDTAMARAVVLYRGNGDIARDDLNGKAPACAVTPAADGSCDLSRYALGSNGALFSPQGGLRISARGLTAIGRLVIGRGAVDGKRILSEASMAAIFADEWRFDGSNGATEDGLFCAYGLAAHTVPNRQSGCNDVLLGARALLGHAGEAYGLRSGLWIDPVRRVGIAYFAANNGEAQTPGRTAFMAIEERLARNLK